MGAVCASAAAVVLSAALLTAAAMAAAPAGFTVSPKLSPSAAFVAGKPASIYCAATMADFNREDAAATGQALGAGFTKVGSSESYLSTWVCSYLNRWLAKKPVTRYHLAVALEVLAHEAELERGITDESLADCAALAITPQLVRRFFPLRGVYTMHDLMADAWAAHDREPAVYLTHCPAR